MLRHESLETLATVLKDLNDAKVDFVAPASMIDSYDGVIHVANAVPNMTPDGVSMSTAKFQPNAVMVEGLASKLDIPLAYLRRLHSQRTDLFDKNVNGWLQGRMGDDADYIGPDTRSFLVRGYQKPEGVWEGRALLSQNYKLIEHLDAIGAALGGIKEAGVEVEVTSCDLTDRRMYVHVNAPGIKALAPELLKGYRSPLSGNDAKDDPGVTAGFVISNSEVGEGAFTITPRFTVLVCKNGMKRTKDAMRAVHLGERLSEGAINWSEETQAKTLELIRLKSRDAVQTFLDIDYMTKVLRSMEDQAQAELRDKPQHVIQYVGKKLSFSDTTIDGVLDHFIRGGQVTAGGIMQAVTSYAQTVEDADQAAALEDSAFRALELASA